MKPSLQLNRNEEKESSAEVAESEQQDSSELIEKSEISSELEIDTTWDDVYSANTGSTGIAVDDDAPIYQGETTESLYDYLIWQLDLTPFSELDRTIALALIDAIDDYGYLTVPLSEILDYQLTRLPTTPASDLPRRHALVK